MSKFTDANVPLQCPECEAYIEGLKETISHIIEFHPGDYTETEAVHFAQEWIEQAHIDQEEQLRDYYEDRKLDKAIHADAFPNK